MTNSDWEKLDRERDEKSITWYLIGFALMTVLFAMAVIPSCARAEQINMEAIKQIESSGNPRAWNKKEDGRGLYQVGPAVLKEWNDSHPAQQYKSDDLWDAITNKKLAFWYMNIRIPQMLRAYGIKDTKENRIIAYNAGIRYLTQKKPIPQTTRKYLAKYAKLAGGAR